MSIYKCPQCVKHRAFRLRSPKACGVYQCEHCLILKSNARGFYYPQIGTTCCYAGCVAEIVDPIVLDAHIQTCLPRDLASIVVNYMFLLEVNEFLDKKSLRCWYHYDKQEECERVIVTKGRRFCCGVQILEKGVSCPNSCDTLFFVGQCL